MTRAHPSEVKAEPETGAGPVPRHVAIIMDGNGRWAEKRGLPRIAGHRAGAEALRKTLRAAVRHGVEFVTVYAFSSENWRRSDEEIADLTGLMRFYLDRELDEIHREGVRVQVIGNIEAFGPDLAKKLRGAVERTSNNQRLTLVVALNYGSRAEIAAAARALVEQATAGEIDPSQIDEAAVAGRLSTAGIPDPDLVIRTSGEIRLSNFLLWQSAYSELMFVEALWPDFDEAVFADALSRFATRDRRFGGR